jgi:hypothetical protein
MSAHHFRKRAPMPDNAAGQLTQQAHLQEPPHFHGRLATGDGPGAVARAGGRCDSWFFGYGSHLLLSLQVEMNCGSYGGHNLLLHFHNAHLMIFVGQPSASQRFTCTWKPAIQLN